MSNIYVIPDLASIILQLIATLIIFLIVKYKFWGPISEFIEKKKALSMEDLTKASTKMTEAEQLFDEANVTIKDARIKANEIISESKKSANAVHDNIIADAKRDADYIKNNAKENIELERQKFYGDLKVQLTDIAMETTKKILDEELDSSKHKKLIDKSIEGLNS